MFQAIGLMLGYNTHYSNKKRIYVGFDNKKYKLLRNSKDFLVKKINYNGIMWCPKVSKTRTFVARRNGRTFITGNSFPEALAVDHIHTWSNEGDLILDPFVGSGTTCIAAKKMNRKYIGIDVSQDYCNLTLERLNDTNRQKNST